MKYTKKQEN